jgi:uncharacterized protein YaaN involved in tellurite resistance
MSDMIANVNTTVPTMAAPVPTRVISDTDIEQLGVEKSTTNDTSRKILAAAKSSDADEFGLKLNELIATAKRLDPAKMAGKGIIGTKEKLLAEYESVDKRMDTLAAELNATASQLKLRVGDLEQMFVENEQSYQFLGKEMERGEEMLNILNQQLQAMGTPTDGFGAQHIADKQAQIQRLEKRIDDLRRGQQLRLLAAPEIRLEQNNKRSLATAFADIQVTTLPAWRGVFSRYILSLETKKAAALATSVYDATDEAFRKQADQVRQNTVEAARVSQRSVISIDTLEYQQQQLLAAVDDAKKIIEEGRAARAAAKPKMEALEAELIKRFSPTK